MGRATRSRLTAAAACALAACTEATPPTPVACNPSLVGTWQATGPVDAKGINASTLQSVYLILSRRADAASTSCERIEGGFQGVGDDGRLYTGSVQDSAPNIAGPVRLVVDVRDAYGGRGSGIPFFSLFTGTFADSATFRGTFELGVPGVPRPSRVVEFRKVTTP